MAIVAGDIKTYLSGGSGNTNPNLSLGGVRSATLWAGGTLHDLFDQISGTENAAAESEYRCIYVRNEHGSLTWEAVRSYIQSQVVGGASVSIGLDPAGVGDGSATGVATTVANEDTAPAGVAFSAPTTDTAGLASGNVGVGQCFAVWIKRAAANTGAVNADCATLAFAGDTAA